METASGTRTGRPQLVAVLFDHLRAGDTLVVWRLDRLGWSLPHLIETIGELEARGVGFKSVLESIDTTTPGGRLVFDVFGALASFERELIQERTLAGLAAARERGRLGGRPTVLSPRRTAEGKTKSRLSAASRVVDPCQRGRGGVDLHRRGRPSAERAAVPGPVPRGAVGDEGVGQGPHPYAGTQAGPRDRNMMWAVRKNPRPHGRAEDHPGRVSKDSEPYRALPRPQRH